MSSVAVSKRIAVMAAELEALLAESVDGSAAERTAAAHEWETFERRLPAMRHRLVGALAQVPADELGEPSLAAALGLASTGQRIVLYARDRGCTFPGCTAPCYHSEVHHRTADWAHGGQTNIDDETLACGKDNRRVKPGGWTTRKRKDGRTEWIPPPNLNWGTSPRARGKAKPASTTTTTLSATSCTTRTTTRTTATMGTMTVSQRGSGLRFSIHAGIQCVTDRRFGP